MTDPRVLSIRPMMDFKVVVLPAPLRPIRQTISPLATSRLISCSTWLAPYQAFRLLTCNIRSCNIRSMLPLAQIDPLHRFVLAHLRWRSLCQELAVVQHQDTIADPQHQLHLVLDQDDRPFAGELHDQIHHDAGFLRTHAGSRLVKQQQPRASWLFARAPPTTRPTPATRRPARSIREAWRGAATYRNATPAPATRRGC